MGTRHWKHRSQNRSPHHVPRMRSSPPPLGHTAMTNNHPARRASDLVFRVGLFSPDSSTGLIHICIGATKGKGTYCTYGHNPVWASRIGTQDSYTPRQLDQGKHGRVKLHGQELSLCPACMCMCMCEYELSLIEWWQEMRSKRLGGTDTHTEK